uniref:Uncharacterized protein n=1 Tax=Ditylenchus dipsaci TaxID=166011 RepID=A0A915DDK7_9BILA
MLIKKFIDDTKKSSFSLSVGCVNDKKKPLPVERLVENEVTGEKLEVKVRQSTSLGERLVSPSTLSVISPGFIVEVVREAA